MKVRGENGAEGLSSFGVENGTLRMGILRRRRHQTQIELGPKVSIPMLQCRIKNALGALQVACDKETRYTCRN